MARLTVVLDACVLYPAPLRDLLLQLAAAEVFRARWTDAIHDEWIRNLLAQRPDLTPDRLQRIRERMNESVLDCLVQGYEYLIPVIDLPDPGDRHVLAAAVHARADAIITFNLRDFPLSILDRHGIDPIHPDDFIHQQMDADPPAVVTAAGTIRRRLRTPPRTAGEYLETLAAQGLPRTVAALRRYQSVL